MGLLWGEHMPKRKRPKTSQRDPLSDPTKANALYELDRAIADSNSSDLDLEFQQQNPRLFDLLPGGIREAYERAQKNKGLIDKLERRLKKYNCSLALPPVSYCLWDLRWFTETHQAVIKDLKAWRKSVRQSLAEDQSPIKKLQLLEGALQQSRLEGIDPERTLLVAKLQAIGQAMGRPKKVKPGDTIRMADPVTSYYVDYRVELGQGRIRLRTVELPGREWLNAPDHGMTHILAACIKGLVEDCGFTAYESGKIIIDLMTIFYPTYTRRTKQGAALAAYRYQYKRRKKVVINSR